MASTSEFLREQHRVVNANMTNPRYPDPYETCTVDKRVISCWRKNAMYGVGVQQGNPTHLQTTEQTQAVAAGLFTRGECRDNCPVTTLQASKQKTETSDPMADLIYGGSGSATAVSAKRISYPLAN